MNNNFVHLRLHSEYSLVDGLVRIKPLVRRIAEAGMPAVAVTDQSNLFAMVKFQRAALEAGVKPVFGADLWVRHTGGQAQAYRLCLLCKNLEGYHNLTHLISRAYLEGQHQGIPVLDSAWFRGHSDGLIALSVAGEGDLATALLAQNTDQAEAWLEFWRGLFADSFYIELQRLGRQGEAAYLRAAVELAIRTATPVVATNDVRFLERSDFDAHEVRVCICEGRTLNDARRPRRYSEHQYLRTAEEMCALFADIPQAIDNTLEIARRCNLLLELGENFLPKFPVPDRLDEGRYLARLAEEGLAQRLAQGAVPDSDKPRYTQRLQRELEVIRQMGFPGYFLIVADFIRWAKENAIPVGPGRGSGAGSLVAYALKITDLDPIAHELLFERFLNPERVSMPDFDIDFCMDRRDHVIEYVAERYGRESVAQIITYGTMAAKAVVRDVGRVLDHSYTFVDKIAKLIPFELGMTLDKALDQAPELRELYESSEEVGALIDMARSLEGLARNAGKHAGGVVIAPSRLTDFCPLYCEQNSSSIVTQFDKNDVEAVGLVKFDFLGLRTLTIIDWALQTVNAARQRAQQPAIDITQIPVDDPSVYALLKRCETTAVFQLESRGMKELIKRLQPDSFEEIVALVALFRPGPLQSGMVDDFIDRKHGRAPVEYPHPALETILKPTYGVILYQEQVMQIAQVLAGYTLGGADILRRAMGKKKPEEMAKQRSVFVDGARNNGVDEKTATSIFDLMEKFAGYGFNKSHSAAYALVSYQTAWLKAHYPAAFMAAVLSADMDNTDKIVTLIEECRDMKLHVSPPDVNVSDYRFTVSDDDGVILYGLGAIKGVGEAAIEIILAEREKNGPFADLYDFCKRLDLRKVNRRVLEALIRCGALDELGPNRATLMGLLPQTIKAAEQYLHNLETGMQDLFGGALDDGHPEFLDQQFPDWDDEVRLHGEKETLGLYLTGHPIERYQAELDGFVSGRIAELVGSVEPEAAASQTPPARQPERQVTVAGLVTSLRLINTRRGRMAVVTLDDRTGRVDVTLYSNLYETYRSSLAKDVVLVVEGVLGPDSFTGGYRVLGDRVFTIEEARVHFGKRLVISLRGDTQRQGMLQSLASVMSPFRQGDFPVWVEYSNEAANAELPLGKDWHVTPSDELLSRLKAVAGEQCVRLEYAACSSSD